MNSDFTLEKLITIACNQVTEADKVKPSQKIIFYTGLIYSPLQSYYLVVILNFDSFHICRMIWSELWTRMWLLGLCITENLSWQAYIRFLCHSLNKIFLLLNLLKILSSHVLWNIYFAYFHSRLRYAIIISGRGGGTKESIQALWIKKKWLD